MAEQRMTTADYDRLLEEVVAGEISKDFASVTSTELKAVRVDSPLEMVAAHGRAIKQKEHVEFVDTRKEDFKAALKAWVEAGEPEDWLRHARGGVIGIQGAG